MNRIELADIVFSLNKVIQSETKVYYEGNLIKNRFGHHVELVGEVSKDPIFEAIDLLSGLSQYEHFKRLISIDISKKFKTTEVIVT